MSAEVAKPKSDAVMLADKVKFRKYGEKDSGSTLRPLVDGLIFRDSICALIGPEHSMKTFIARDLCASVASGNQCYGRKVSQGMVFFIVGEGNSQIELRFRAYEHGHEVTLRGDDLRHTDRSVSFANEETVKALSDKIAKLAKISGKRPALICIDPLSKVMLGLDENSATDMGEVVKYSRTPVKEVQVRSGLR